VLGDRIYNNVEQSVVTYKNPVTYKNQTIPVRVSIGFAVAEEGKPADYDKLKHVAAAALSEAKISGRRRCVLSASSTGANQAVPIRTAAP